MTYTVTNNDKRKLKACKAEFEGQFMQPKFYMGRDIESELMHNDMDCEQNKLYARLSADGYMDATDYSGPYDSLADAADSLVELYGMD